MTGDELKAINQHLRSELYPRVMEILNEKPDELLLKDLVIDAIFEGYKIGWKSRQQEIVKTIEASEEKLGFIF